MTASEPLDEEFRAAWHECLLNGRPINWEFWVLKMPKLSLLQASLLMNGLDPGIKRDITNMDADVKKAMDDSERLAALASALGIVALSPTEWLDWADHNKMVVHALYRIEVLKLNALVDTSSESSKPRKQKSEPTWIAEAQKLAKYYIENQLAYDRHPSLLTVGDHVAEQLRGRGIFGPQGKPLRGETIKRHALAGMSTQQNKLKDISKQWGKRGNN
jgi:hypothetical protein